MSQKWIITIELRDDDEASEVKTVQDVREMLEVNLPTSDDFTVTITQVNRA